MQRPPFNILIFEQADLAKIVKFTQQTFFRHFSLYEFAFKPRMELMLKCEPFLNTKFNAQLPKLEEMNPLEPDEAEKFKVYLSLYTQQLGELAHLDADPLKTEQLLSERQLGYSGRESKMGADDQEQEEDEEEE